MLSFTSLIAQPPPIDMYISKQTNEFCPSFSGIATKTTDQYEHGEVTISTTGPIKQEIDPNPVTININETKSWNGSVQPDVDAAPAAGETARASLIYNYDVHYSRPEEFPGGINFPGGVITSEVVEGSYSCSGGCWYHADDGGHKLIHKIGSISQDFNVHSIKVSFKKDKYKLRPGKTRIIEAISFPANIGTITWSVSNDKIKILATNNNKVKIKGIKNGKAILNAKFTVCGNVTYTATCKIIVLPKLKLIRKKVKVIHYPGQKDYYEIPFEAINIPAGLAGNWEYTIQPDTLHKGHGSYPLPKPKNKFFLLVKKPQISADIKVTVSYTYSGVTESASMLFTLTNQGAILIY